MMILKYFARAGALSLLALFAPLQSLVIVNNAGHSLCISTKSLSKVELLEAEAHLLTSKPQMIEAGKKASIDFDSNKETLWVTIPRVPLEAVPAMKTKHPTTISINAEGGTVEATQPFDSNATIILSLNSVLHKVGDREFETNNQLVVRAGDIYTAISFSRTILTKKRSSHD